MSLLRRVADISRSTGCRHFSLGGLRAPLRVAGVSASTDYVSPYGPRVSSSICGLRASSRATAFSTCYERCSPSLRYWQLPPSTGYWRRSLYSLRRRISQYRNSCAVIYTIYGGFLFLRDTGVSTGYGLRASLYGLRASYFLYVLRATSFSYGLRASLPPRAAGLPLRVTGVVLLLPATGIPPSTGYGRASLYGLWAPSQLAGVFFSTGYSSTACGRLYELRASLRVTGLPLFTTCSCGSASTATLVG
jgi:hypothetical protein